jgi:hypothetical protein
MEGVMTCPCCKKRYNLKEREPIFHECCYKVSCRECINNRMVIDHSDPQNITDSSMKEGPSIFHCELCNKKLSRFPSTPFDMVIQLLKAIPQTFIVCERHPEQAADQYCKRHRTLICHRCAFDEHADHRNEFVEVKNDIIEEYLERKLGDLVAKKNSIESLILKLQQLKTKDT